MKKQTIVIRLIISLLLMGMAVWFLTNQKYEYANERMENDLERIKIENDSLKQNNLRLDEQLKGYKATTDSLKRLLKDNDKEIVQLKLTRYEKVERIGAFNYVELYKFFTEFKTQDTAR